MIPSARELCVEPFEISTILRYGGAPADWEFDGRDVAVPRIMAAPDGVAYVLYLDPVTGAVRGSPVRAADGIVRNWSVLPVTLGNGPEWGYSARGSELYYMRPYGSLSRALWKAFQTQSGAWSAVPLPGGEHRGVPWPSKTASDPTPGLVYAVYPRTGIQTVLPYDVATRTVPEDPQTERVIPVPVVAKVGGPRWVPGQRRIVFTRLDAWDQEQVALFDAETGVVEPVTAEGGLSIDETWASVYQDGTVALWWIEGGTDLRVWTKGSGSWAEANRVTLGSSDKPYILSPEPFAYQGRRYIVYQACASPSIADQPSDIWICEPSATTPCHFRLVSPPSGVTRRKPEALELPDKLAVYYLDGPAGARSIVQAETGL